MINLCNVFVDAFENSNVCKYQVITLALIWVGFLMVRFEVGVGQDYPTPTPSPCLKHVRIMLKISNLARSTHTYVVSENTFNFADVSIFFVKNWHFLTKILPLLKAICES